RPSRTPPPPPPPPPTPRDPGHRLARSGGADAGRAPGRGSTAARLPAGGRARGRVQRREVPFARLPGGDLRADGGGGHGLRPSRGPTDPTMATRAATPPPNTNAVRAFETWRSSSWAIWPRGIVTLVPRPV